MRPESRKMSGEHAPMPADSCDDRELTLAFQRGEQWAYDDIHERYAHRVHCVCKRMLGDHSDAEEAAQETFLRVYKALEHFNGRYQLGAWIARIATNVCLDHLRARSRRPLEAELIEDVGSEHGHDADPGVMFERDAEGRRVRRVLASLPPLHRAAIVLRDFEGLSYVEVAGALDITESQVKALIHRARNNFKRSWSGAGMAALLPWRWTARLREVDPAGKEHAGQVVASGGQLAAQCSAVLQHCGQFVTERVAPVFAAAAVGAASVGAAVASDRGAEAESHAARAWVEGGNPLNDLMGGSTRGTGRKPGAAKPKTSGASDAEQTSVASGAAPAPTPSPTPTASSGGSGSGNGSGGTPSPTPTPSQPPPEPAGFTASFSHGAASRATPCDCLWGTRVNSETATGDENGLYAYNQAFTGTATAAGDPAYGLEARHWTPSANRHEMTFTLWTAAGSYQYRASGTFEGKKPTNWGGWSYTFSGTYERAAWPGNAEEMPRRGGYKATVTFSWRRERILSTNISLSEG